MSSRGLPLANSQSPNRTLLKVRIICALATLAAVTCEPTLAQAKELTAAEMSHFVKSHICPPDLSRYRLLTYEEFCGKNYMTDMKPSEIMACQNKVGELNTQISEYNMWVFKCISAEQERKYSHPAPPPVARSRPDNQGSAAAAQPSPAVQPSSRSAERCPAWYAACVQKYIGDDDPSSYNVNGLGPIGKLATDYCHTNEPSSDSGYCQ